MSCRLSPIGCLHQRQQNLALPPDLAQIGRVREDELGDAEFGIFAQRSGNLLRRTHQPGRAQEACAGGSPGAPLQAACRSSGARFCPARRWRSRSSRARTALTVRPSRRRISATRGSARMSSRVGSATKDAATGDVVDRRASAPAAKTELISFIPESGTGEPPHAGLKHQTRRGIAGSGPYEISTTHSHGSALKLVARPRSRSVAL